MATSKKPIVQEPPPITALHDKYRPRTLEKVIGHTNAVTRLKGIVSSGKWPSALAFFGPTSAGKTTLAYALGCSAFGVNKVGDNTHPDFTEICGTDSKTIDDMRELIRISKLRPMKAPRRFVLVDEAQGVLTNPQAASALLAALERPPKSTTWIFTSMDPDKFAQNTTGKALANRCTQFHLKAPEEADLVKQAKRIIRGEEMTYIDQEQIDSLVGMCNGEMRTLANMLQNAQSYYEGLEGKKPKVLSTEAFTEVVSASVSSDENVAINILAAVYTGKLQSALKHILEIQDGYGVVNKMLQYNWNAANNLLLKGARHPKVWLNAPSKVLSDFMKDKSVSLDTAMRMHSQLVALKARAQTFGVGELMLLGQFVTDTIPLIRGSKE